MSADGGKAVLRFDWTEDGMQYHQHGQYVGHEDYAKLEQQRAALVEALEDLCAQLGECGMTEKARAALLAAGVVLS